MFSNRRFRRSTWSVDAILIWGTTLTTLAGFVIGLIEGRGVAISLLIAAGILPLAFVSAILVGHHKRAFEAARRWFSSPGNTPHDSSAFMYDPQDEAPDLEAYYDLIEFVLNYLLPACDAQVELQKAIVRRLSGNEAITKLAIDGLQFGRNPETQPFWKDYDQLAFGVDSSGPTIKYSAIIDCIRGLERSGYRELCEYTGKLANFDFTTDSDTGALWEAWRERHNALTRKYGEIKRNPRHEKLFFPRREGRWGGEIPPVDG